MLDGIDRKIVNLIQANARISNIELARQIGMAPSATLERVRKLEAQGVITGYKACINPKSVGLELVAFIMIRANENVNSISIGELLARIPEVLEVHHVAGEDCYLVKVRTANTEALGRLLRDKIGAIDAVTSTRSTIVLETMKETTDVPVEEPTGD
jgi:Lrp/AsnC family leucine-responsive transcriptional regulator